MSVARRAPAGRRARPAGRRSVAADRGRRRSGARRGRACPAGPRRSRPCSGTLLAGRADEEVALARLRAGDQLVVAPLLEEVEARRLRAVVQSRGRCSARALLRRRSGAPRRTSVGRAARWLAPRPRSARAPSRSGGCAGPAATSGSDQVRLPVVEVELRGGPDLVDRALGVGDVGERRPRSGRCRGGRPRARRRRARRSARG